MPPPDRYTDALRASPCMTYLLKMVHEQTEPSDMWHITLFGLFSFHVYRR